MNRCLPKLPLIAALVAVGLTLHVGVVVGSSPSFDAAHDARIQLMGPDGDVEALLNALCPAHPIVDEQRSGCGTCPDEADADTGSLSLRRAYIGRFSGTTEKQAVVALNGCASERDRRHATAFFERGGDGDDDWALVRYEQGLQASPCHLVTVGARPVLICRARQLDDGMTTTEVSALHHNGDEWSHTSLIHIGDGARDCQFEGSYIRQMQRIYTGSLLHGDDREVLGLLVEHHRGVPQSDADDSPRCHRHNYHIERNWHLEIFDLASGELESVDIDQPCAHPRRARILSGADPNACR